MPPRHILRLWVPVRWYCFSIVAPIWICLLNLSGDLLWLLHLRHIGQLIRNPHDLIHQNKISTIDWFFWLDLWICSRGNLEALNFNWINITKLNARHDVMLTFSHSLFYRNDTVITVNSVRKCEDPGLQCLTQLNLLLSHNCNAPAQLPHCQRGAEVEVHIDLLYYTYHWVSSMKHKTRKLIWTNSRDPPTASIICLHSNVWAPVGVAP